MGHIDNQHESDPRSKRAIVLLSGGQDSTTCLYWALDRFETVHALSINYGQKHHIENDAAKKIAEMANVSLEILDLPRLLVGTSPLVSDNELGKYDNAEELPGGIEPTFVPGRNALFLVIAANRAMAKGARHIVTGVCEEDYGGYPDCRQVFITSMQKSIGLAMTSNEAELEIHTPLMSLNKKATVFMAQRFDGCMDAIAWSHTCYEGSCPPCGECHACILRSRGFEQAGVADPLVERCEATNV